MHVHFYKVLSSCANNFDRKGRKQGNSKDFDWLKQEHILSLVKVLRNKKQ